MPRRRIGADLKEALCKLYEAGDISADTIEKHRIMSRATFFRNLKLYKSGSSLEQRHSTGRKSNADKIKEQEKQEFDQLQPCTLDHLELVLLDDRYTDGAVASKSKRKSAVDAGGSKSKKRDQPHETLLFNEEAGFSEGSVTDTDSDDDSASLAARQNLRKLSESAREYLLQSAQSLEAPSSFAELSSDLDSLLKSEDSQYSYKNRGAMYLVRTKTGEKSIVAVLALRSLIWTPQVYQALGHSYAARSIDRICSLSWIHVDSSWRRRGIGQWLLRVAELKASKLGFSHLYTQSKAECSVLLTFWRKCDLIEFARFDNLARLEKPISTLPKGDRKRTSEHPLSTSKGSDVKRKKSQVSRQVASPVIPAEFVSAHAPLADHLPPHRSTQSSTIAVPPFFGMLSQQRANPESVFNMQLADTSLAISSPESTGRSLQSGLPPRRIAFHEADVAIPHLK